MDVASNFTPLIPLEKVENELFGVSLTEAQKIDRAMGRSVFLENMRIGDSLKDGKIQLVLDKAGEVKNKIDFKAHDLEIPKELFGKKLSEEEIEKLHHGAELKLNNDGIDYFVKIDKELNKVVVRSGNQIEELKEIGGYKLDMSEEAKILKGERLDPKVYKGKDGYFVANCELTGDKKGIEFSNIKSISAEEAKELMLKLNKPAESHIIDNVVSAFESKVTGKENSATIIDQNLSSSPTEKINSKDAIGTFENRLLNLIDKNELPKVPGDYIIDNPGYPLNDPKTIIDYIDQKNFSPEEKQAWIEIVNMKIDYDESEKEYAKSDVAIEAFENSSLDRAEAHEHKLYEDFEEQLEREFERRNDEEINRENPKNIIGTEDILEMIKNNDLPRDDNSFVFNNEFSLDRLEIEEAIKNDINLSPADKESWNGLLNSLDHKDFLSENPNSNYSDNSYDPVKQYNDNYLERAEISDEIRYNEFVNQFDEKQIAMIIKVAANEDQQYLKDVISMNPPLSEKQIDAIMSTNKLNDSEKSRVLETLPISQEKMKALEKKYDLKQQLGVPPGKVTAFEKLKGEIEGQFKMLYVGKDSNNNLYQSTDGKSATNGNWTPLDKDAYKTYKKELHTLPITSTKSMAQKDNGLSM